MGPVALVVRADHLHVLRLPDLKVQPLLELLGGLRGLLVGRPWGYTDPERRELREVLLNRTARYDFPIVADMDFGHTTPQLTLPLGCAARIDAAAKRFELMESAVA